MMEPKESHRHFASVALLAALCTGVTFAQTVSPAILTQPDGTAFVLHSYLFPVTAQNPAQQGEVLTLFATGLGPTNPPVASGQPGPVSPPAVTATVPTLTAGGRLATVVASQLAPGAIGLYQVTFA